MPKITLDITARRKRIIEALAEDRNCTVDQLLEPYLRDLEENAAGIRADLPDAVKDAITEDVVAKAAAKKAARISPTPAA